MTNQVKRKPKISTLGKSYPIEHSGLYKLRSKRVLSELLGVSIDEIERLRTDPDSYNEFEDKTNPEKPRKIQKPRTRLDFVQSRIASLICRIQLPHYLESGRKGHSHVTNAEAHISQQGNNQRILTTDIRHFFPSTTWDMVQRFFRDDLKCSQVISNILSDLCTCRKFVPTGSRISMPIAYWANNVMFSELERLSQKHNITMSIYVDDLTFSGENINKLFLSCVRKIITRHGHEPHPNKTRLYDKSEVKVITGVAISNNSLQATNAQHFKIFQDIEAWKAIKDVPFASELTTFKKLIGRLNSLSLIDKRFKDKVRSIKSSTS